jgi:hypothetical protein
MQYLLMIYSNEAGWAELSEAQREEGVAAYTAFTQALRHNSALLASNRLQPIRTATTVRLKDDKPVVLDGPYADTREQLGGYFLIEAPDLDGAIAWAAKCPGAGHGVVEVRPVWAM